MVEFAKDYAAAYAVGALIGIGIAVAGMVVSMAAGFVAAIGRISTNSIPNALASAYVAVFRGIPPLLTLYIFYFGLPSWGRQVGIPAVAVFLAPLNNRVVTAMIALGINSGAYSAEIIRSAIQSIHGEQMEAARSLGMPYWLAMRRIILPQAARVAFPPLGNEFITLLKGTSLASVIGVAELMRKAQEVASATFKNLLAYSMAGIIYIGLVIVLQVGVSILERRMRRSTD